MKCSVAGCGLCQSKNRPNLNFHRLPRNEYRRREWLENIGLKNIRPGTQDIHVCSLHFEESAFNKTLNIIRLRDDAIPTVFAKMPLSSAERCRKYREKLKETNLQKYEDMKKKNAERTKAKKIKIQDMDENKKQETRKKWRDAKRKKKQPIEDNPELVEEREVEKNMNMSPCAMEAQESHREMDNYEKSSHASEEACEEDSIDSEDEPATDSISSDEQENKELSQQNTFITNKQIKEHEEIKYDTETFKSEENIVPPETHKKEFVDTHAIDNSECSESTEIETEYGIILSEPFSAGSCMAQMKDNGQTIKKRVAIINKVFKDDGSGVLKLRNISSRVNVDPKTPFIQNGSTNETIADEFDTFGKHVASQLRQLSTESYLLAQGELQNVLSKYRLRDLKNL